MGVPAFYRWLSDKCEKIVTPAAEDPLNICDGVMVPTDTSQPNPNGVEYDNLYLDMNGIIHPCCHPEDRPAPTTEDEMILHIFQYMDRIFSIIRPRQLIYMAVDGVAPRAKMNQQRSRRFRAAKEASDKEVEKEELRAQMIRDGLPAPTEETKAHFDSNCITPGTEFMAHLTECLRYYIHERLNTDPGWRNVKVILSDATVPGEGEHKIIDFIRKQRADPGHNPNTMHCFYGADADLIFLSLSTHEPHFHVLREDVKPAHQKPCFLCGQMGHTKEFCTGTPEQQTEALGPIHMDKEFILIKINVLREYLEVELYVEGLPFVFDIERALDDWVFLCFFVGNDFLPHMPSLEIKEGAIDRLVAIWKKNLPKLGGYLTHNGTVDCKRVQMIFKDLGEVEDEIFRERKVEEDRMKERRKRRKLDDQARKEAESKWMDMAQYQPVAVGSAPTSNVGLGKAIRDQRQEQFQKEKAQEEANKKAAAELRKSLHGGETSAFAMAKATGTPTSTDSKPTKRPAETETPEPENTDEVRLWEEGWKSRYYESKFGIGIDNVQMRTAIVQSYIEGLCWVLAYYYQGCASWTWYYPYHYSPFASDIAECEVQDKVEFERNTKAFQPLEQLMGVLPAVSGKRFLPPAWNKLMYDPESPILDFYPTDFKLDLNGKPFAWMGVALLPFIDEERLFKALAPVSDELTDIQKERNKTGNDYLFISKKHPAFNSFCSLYEKGSAEGDEKEFIPLDTKLTQGMCGNVARDDGAVLPGSTFHSPLTEEGQPDINDNQVLGVCYENQHYSETKKFQAKLLPGLIMPPRVTTKEDIELFQSGGRRGRGRGRGGRGGRGRGGNFNNQQPAGRMIQHSLNQGIMPPPVGPPGRGGYSGGGYGQPPVPMMGGYRPPMMGAYRPPMMGSMPPMGGAPYGGQGNDRQGGYGGYNQGGAQQQQYGGPGNYNSQRGGYIPRGGQNQQRGGYRGGYNDNRYRGDRYDNRDTRSQNWRQ